MKIKKIFSEKKLELIVSILIVISFIVVGLDILKILPPTEFFKWTSAFANITAILTIFYFVCFCVQGFSGLRRNAKTIDYIRDVEKQKTKIV